MTSDLTTVELIFYDQQINHWVRFGREAGERVIDRRRRLRFFAPGAVFAFVRWQGNEYGTVLSRIDILRAVRPDQPASTVPGVTPGGESLLWLSGWPMVKRVFAIIDAIESAGIDAADVAPEYWCHLHNRLAAGERPRAYTKAQHAAFLLRRRASP